MESDEIQAIENDGDSHKYFHQMLNMADDDLDPYEYRLLGHYIRVGKCRQGLTTIAKITRMSKAKVIETRATLEVKGYINNSLPTVEDARKGKTVYTTVVDRWVENIARYAKPSNNSYQPSQNRYQLGGKNQNRKNNNDKNNQKEESPNGVISHPEKRKYTKQELDDLHDAICEVWKVEPDEGKVLRIKSILLGNSKAKGWAHCNVNPPCLAHEIRLWRAWYRGDYLPQKPENIQSSVYEFRRHTRLETDRTQNGQESDTLVSQWDSDNAPIQQGIDYS